MLSDDYHYDSVASFDLDDLISIPDTSYLQNDDSEYSSILDEIIKEDLFSSPDTDQYQHQQISPDNSTQESQVSVLECGVCGAPAFGYNFDQITCESCKAFFRRNAFRNMSELKCRFTGCCEVNVRTRRQCTYCRLKKCFDIKMRKDWIRTEEEKQVRQLQKLVKEQKKQNHLTDDELALLSVPIVLRRKKRLLGQSKSQDGSSSPICKRVYFAANCVLHDNDQSLLNNINNAYTLALEKVDYSYVNKYTSNTCFSVY